MTKERVLVTGADGFIGSHLTEALLAEGYAVRALAQYNSFNSWGWLDGISHPDLEVITGDVRDPRFCSAIAKDCTTIYHLAALIAIPFSYSAPDSYVDTNIKGTLNMCQAARDANVKRIVVTSTSEVYGTAQYVPIDEKHPKQPQSPYSATKIAADALALSFFHSFDLPVVVARPFNTFGPRQSLRAIIPSIITQIATGKTEIAVGDLTPTRDFNFVTDTAAGFIALANTPGIEGREINIATGHEVSMCHTLETIAGLMGKDVRFTVDPARLRPAGSEVFRLCGDSTLIRSLTSWTPAHNLEEGLRKTIDWFTRPENLSLYKTDMYHL